MLKYLRWTLVWIWFALATTLLSIFFLFRPKHPLNAYITTHSICTFALKILGIRVDLENPEDLEKHQPCVYIANHQSVLDIFVFGSIFPKYTFVIGKKSLKYVPFFGWVFTLSDNVYIDRKNYKKAISELSKAEERIRNGKKSLFLFPEGTRSRGKGLGPFKKGAFHVASNCQVPIVALVSENYSINIGSIKKNKVRVKVLGPYTVEKEKLEPQIEKIRTDILEFQNS